jgi:RHS repeat-associated protein
MARANLRKRRKKNTAPPTVVIPAQNLPSTPDNEYTYDNLDRVTQAEYLVGVQTVDEEFTYDDLGNRTSVELRDDNTETYAVNNLTNRYNETTGGPYDIELEYDDAGNMTTDHNNYEYLYDYENRLVKITDGVYNIAEYTYDALGRRIEMKVYDNGEVDSVTRYYYNNNWQVLAETDYDSTGPTETQLRDYIYGNYIDEVLIMTDDSDAKHYYGHDHIFSVVTLIEPDGDVEERYEYDAYGKPTISNAGFTQTYDTSQFGNPYMFTSRCVDSLDSDDLQLQYNRNRYYDYHTGRWLTHDPLGIVPNGYVGNTAFIPTVQYGESRNIYEYVQSNPVLLVDARGLKNYKIGMYEPGISFPNPPGWIHQYSTEDGWGSLQPPTKKDRELHKDMLGYATSKIINDLLPNSSRLLRHYLENSGSTSHINTTGGNSSLLASSKSASDNFINEINDAMNFVEGNADSVNADSCKGGACKIKESNESSSFFITSQAWSDGKIPKSESLDWHFAINKYRYMGRGRVTPMPSCEYKMQFHYYVYDRYDWNPGDVFDLYIRKIKSDDMNRLHLVGLARNFNVWGAANLTITWKKGIDLKREHLIHLVQKNNWSLPGNIRLIW